MPSPVRRPYPSGTVAPPTPAQEPLGVGRQIVTSILTIHYRRRPIPRRVQRWILLSAPLGQRQRLAPLLRVAQHIEQAQVIRLQLPHGGRLLSRPRLERPGISPQQVLSAAVVPARVRPRPTCVFPLRLQW